MRNLLETKVSYEKTLENGTQKRVTETYVIDALSFTECEATMTNYIKAFNAEFEIISMKKAGINELFLDEAGDIWYNCKVYFITLDEKSGNEKRTGATMLVQASNIGQAKQTLENGMKGTLSDYTIGAIKETSVVDVILK